MTEEYDVIIIGAGPAGLVAAEKCAIDGLKTLCLEKKQEIGVPKRCAEGLGLGWIKRLGMTPDKKWAVQDISGAALYSPSGKKLEIRFHDVSGYVIERRVFEKELAKKASQAGATIRTKSNVTELKRENGKVNVTALEMEKTAHYSAPIIIACDGVESTIARKLGLNTVLKLNDVDSGFQYEMAGIEFENPDLIHLYFGIEVAPRGYLWIFPKGKDVANVGIGIGGTHEKSAKYYLDKFISAHPGLKKGSIIEVNAGAIPVGGFLKEMTADNLIVCGDAAHQVNPIHGGGMGTAMEAAILASKIAVEAHKKGDFSNETLKPYNSQWYELRGNQMLAILKRRHMLESMKDNDFEILVNSLTGEDVLKISEGELWQSAKIVTKKLIKHPNLAKIMLKYLK